MVSDREKSLIAQFVSNQELVDVVKRFLVPRGFSIRLDMTNEVIGAEHRARERARELVDEAFRELGTYRAAEVPNDGKNPAR